MDKRRNNGGNSTKSKGVDKRKNEYKDILNDALSTDEIKQVVKMLHRKSLTAEDTTAAKILLEYYIGKPSQQLDINASVDTYNIISLGSGVKPE
tara:strand:+ start:173 stop:454 length:282 start_codon:yes stop_codon:yes gene_type:complete